MTILGVSSSDYVYVPRKLICTTYSPDLTSPGSNFHASFAFSFRHPLTASPDFDDHRDRATRASLTPWPLTVTNIATPPRSEGSIFWPNSSKQNRENACSRFTDAMSAGGAGG